MLDEIELLDIIENYFQTILIVVLAVILERFVVLSYNSNPLTFFRLLFDRMSKRVNSEEPYQSTIAGTLGIAAIVLPFFIIIYLIREFAHYTFIIDILLLWVSLQVTNDLKAIEKTKVALECSKKELAKNLISSKVLRDTATLTHLGIIKAAIESSFLRYQYQHITPIVVFVLFGPIASLTYRLIYEAHHQWHTKLMCFSYFGTTCFYIVKLIQLPICMVFQFLYLLCFNNKAFYSQIFQRRFWLIMRSAFNFRHQTSSLWVLSLVLQKDCNGPLIYEGRKHKRPRYKNLCTQLIDDPEINDLDRLLRSFVTFSFLFIGSLGLLSFFRFSYEF